MVTLQQLKAFWQSEYETGQSTKDLIDRMQEEGFADDVPHEVMDAACGWASAPAGEEAGRWWDIAEKAMGLAPNT